MAPKTASELAFLCRALKAPSLAAAADRLAERARAEYWTHEEYLAACLDREVSARQSHGGESRIRAARFPARKTLEDALLKATPAEALAVPFGAIELGGPRAPEVVVDDATWGGTAQGLGPGMPARIGAPGSRCAPAPR